MGTMGLQVEQHYWRCCDASNHYCRLLLTRHYDQRPFDKIVCDELIANGDVKNHQKRCKTFVMAEPSNTVQILVVCAIQATRLTRSNCCDEAEQQKRAAISMCVCDIRHTVRSDEPFSIRECNINGQPDQGVCDIRHTVQSNELFSIREENINGST